MRIGVWSSDVCSSDLDEQMERVLPLVKKHGAAVVAISNDETGISMDPDVRYAVAKKIVERAADYGIPKEDVVVDPLVMRSEEHTSELQSLMRISYAVFCLKKKKATNTT